MNHETIRAMQQAAERVHVRSVFPGGNPDAEQRMVERENAWRSGATPEQVRLFDQIVALAEGATYTLTSREAAS